MFFTLYCIYIFKYKILYVTLHVTGTEYLTTQPKGRIVYFGSQFKDSVVGKSWWQALEGHWSYVFLDKKEERRILLVSSLLFFFFSLGLQPMN